MQHHAPCTPEELVLLPQQFLLLLFAACYHSPASYCYLVVQLVAFGAKAILGPST